MQFNPVSIDFIQSIPTNTRKPACHDTLVAFLNSGEAAAEITAWQDKYATRETLYNSVRDCAKRYFPSEIKVLKSGGKTFVVRLK